MADYLALALDLDLVALIDCGCDLVVLADRDSLTDCHLVLIHCNRLTGCDLVLDYDLGLGYDFALIDRALDYDLAKDSKTNHNPK